MNNYLTHREQVEFDEVLSRCNADRDRAACERVAQLQDLDLQRDTVIDSCEGLYTATCVGARWDLQMAAAEFRQQHSNGIDWGERYGLSRHMVYLQSVGNFDPADLVYRQQLGLTVPSFADPTAAELANSRTRDQLEQAVLEPVLLGAIAYGGLGSARTLLGGPAPLPTSTVMTRNVIDERVFIGSVRMSPVQRSIVNNLTGAGDAIIVGTNNPAARLPQDLAVSPVPPNAINTAGRRVGLNANQNA